MDAKDRLFNRKLRWGIASVRLQTDLALEKGLSLAACLAGSGITPAMLEDPDVEIEAAQELAVIGNILAALGDRGRGLGLEAGLRYRLTTFGIWGYALLCSPTLRDALELGLRFIDLSHSPCRVWTEQDERETSIFLDASHLPPAIQTYAIERTVACIVTLQKEVVGMPIPLYRLWFGHAPQAAPEIYKTALHITPEFERSDCVGTFDTRLLDIRLPRSDALSWKMCQAQCLELMHQRKFREGWSGRVRDLLLGDPANIPSFDDIAARLDMIPLKLRRTLAAEGSNYRSLIDEVKCMLAEQILLIDNITVQQASIRLGYENSISFTQSFKRWTGMTPSDYMQARRRKPGMGNTLFVPNEYLPDASHLSAR
ncbi:MAG: AraC family transcriptional regulator [Pseudomonadota bacterium]